MERSVKSARRTLQIMEHFARVQRPQTVGVLATALDVPQPSMTMLLRNIEDLGYLDYDRAERTYFPTIRTLLLGSWLERNLNQGSSLGCEINKLHGEIGEEVYLCRQSGPFIQYVIRHGVKIPCWDAREVRRRNLLTRSTGGQAILASKSDEEVLGWVNRCNAEARDESLQVRRRDYLDLVARVRERGYSETHGEYISGYSGMAMTFVLRIDGSPLVAISVGGPSARVDQKTTRIVDAMREFVQHYSMH